MKNNCIVVQMDIRNWDIQGSLYFTHKQDILDLSIESLRNNNREAYIILSGWGHQPLNSTKKNCDEVIWDERLYPLDEQGRVINFPAQFPWVQYGIKVAKDAGFDFCLKTRGDCLILRENIVDWCHDILLKENKRLLITQMSAKRKFRIGDCFQYGPTHLLDDIWSCNHGVHFLDDGTKCIGYNFAKYGPNEHEEIQSDEQWERLLKRECSFRDVINIPFLDLRHNYHKLKNSWEETREKALDNVLSVKDYYWGAHEWHKFVNGRDTIKHDGYCFDEKDFYYMGMG